MARLLRLITSPLSLRKNTGTGSAWNRDSLNLLSSASACSAFWRSRASWASCWRERQIDQITPALIRSASKMEPSQKP
ncbi:hypothetical protein D3C80_1639030 [compost metagenome]